VSLRLSGYLEYNGCFALIDKARPKDNLLSRLNLLMTKFGKSRKTELSGLPFRNIWFWQFQSKTEEWAKFEYLKIQGVSKLENGLKGIGTNIEENQFLAGQAHEQCNLGVNWTRTGLKNTKRGPLVSDPGAGHLTHAMVQPLRRAIDQLSLTGGTGHTPLSLLRL
jgi:hypothetical protein